MEWKRIRVAFKDDDILSETQKFDGLARSWILLKPCQHDTVSDVAHSLLQAFHLHDSCPHGLILSISGFVLPPFESIHILKDNEIVRVQKRTEILAIERKDTRNDVGKLKDVGKQPVNSGLLLLANDELEKEKGCYESDEPEDDDEDNLLEDVENPSTSNMDKRNRKRKAADKLQCSKEKRQRTDATGKASDDVQTEKFASSHQDADFTKKKSLSSKIKRNGSVAENIVHNNGEPSTKRIDEVQENGKETEDAKIAPQETKKVPSRSARRTYAKRKWLREMAKIQKQNANCESEGLRNWKEDQAKAGRKKVDGQAKGQKKWKKHQADAEGNVADGQPKGLLHWTPQDNWNVKGKKHKQRSQNNKFRKLPYQNDDAHERQIQTGDGPEQPTQNGCGLEQSNLKQGDAHEHAIQKGAVQECKNQSEGDVQECKNQSGDASEQLNQESGEENVPVVIRPGHIRFEPSGKDAEQANQKDHVPVEIFQRNGSTTKEKGQQRGRESRSLTPLNDYKTPNKEQSEILSYEKEKQADAEIEFDKLPPLVDRPKEGDLIAYRILELSSSWTPELSPFRVGKVSWYDTETNQATLVPVPAYPLVSKKADEDESEQLDKSLYKDDGSLDIDLSTLIDARSFNNGRPEPGNGAFNCVRQVSTGDVNDQTVVPSQESFQDKETQPAIGDVSVNIWDQLSETLNAKKEQLSKENGWDTTPKKVQASVTNTWGSSATKVQPSQENGLGKKPSLVSNWGNAQKAQPSKENSWGKQSSGSKSWSYKALRGSALGPTMAILRSKKDI